MTDQIAGTPQSLVVAARNLAPDVREIHRAVLRSFRDSGSAHRTDLRDVASAPGVDLDDALRVLSEADLVHVASDGQVEVAYPFSARAAGHTVSLEGRPPVQAMCAIDALGIPLMTRADGVIRSSDPDTGESITIHRRGEVWTWQPDSAVVVLSHATACGTLASAICGSITFHTDRDSAASYLATRHGLNGTILSQDEAVSLADEVFGGLLSD